MCVRVCVRVCVCVSLCACSPVDHTPPSQGALHEDVGLPQREQHICLVHMFFFQIAADACPWIAWIRKLI